VRQRIIKKRREKEKTMETLDRKFLVASGTLILLLIAAAVAFA
jgi:hypothetical protein